MAVTTLLDIAKMNGSDREVGLIEEVLPALPELALFPARTIKGLNFKTLVRTTLPTVSFRNANEGSTSIKSTYENRLVECFIMNPQWDVDAAVADAHEDGPEALLAIEATGMTIAGGITLAKQIYYGSGTGGDAKGYPGFIQAYDSTNMVVDATGSTASTGSSVWAVKFGPQHVQMLYGNNGQLTVSDPQRVRLLDSESKPYTGLWQEMMARPGMQVCSRYAIGRIKNLTAQAGKGLTDALLAQLLTKFPVGFPPDVFLMSRRSLEQLRSSRTATNATGAPAPTPTEAFGIPIKPTDSILDTETIG